MDWPAWEPLYTEILQDFGWHPEDDEASARALQSVVPARDTFRNVGTELKHRPVATVLGCGPSLETATREDLLGIVVAADGATQWCMEQGVVPRVVVTDLDGDPDALRWAAAQGASIVVHAHGDNADRFDIVGELGPFVAGTCQCNPEGLEPLRNLGGFTDGDRAVALCAAYGVQRVHLVGFDFEKEPSRYTGAWNPETKLRKLAWAQRLIAGVAASSGLTITRP